jgi:hypothetical protein
MVLHLLDLLIQIILEWLVIAAASLVKSMVAHIRVLVTQILKMWAAVSVKLMIR